MLVVHEGFLTVRDTSQSFFLCLSYGDPIKESHIKRAGICLIIVKAYNQVILLRESASGRSLNDLLVHIHFSIFQVFIDEMHARKFEVILSSYL